MIQTVKVHNIFIHQILASSQANLLTAFNTWKAQNLSFDVLSVSTNYGAESRYPFGLKDSRSDGPYASRALAQSALDSVLTALPAGTNLINAFVFNSDTDWYYTYCTTASLAVSSIYTMVIVYASNLKTFAATVNQT